MACGASSQPCWLRPLVPFGCSHTGCRGPLSVAFPLGDSDPERGRSSSWILDFAAKSPPQNSISTCSRSSILTALVTVIQNSLVEGEYLIGSFFPKGVGYFIIFSIFSLYFSLCVLFFVVVK